MKINEKGLSIITHFEGLRLEAYQDRVGIWTIGWGHTKTARPGMRITEAEAVALLRADLKTHEKFITQVVTVTLNPDQFSALVSFAFNVGNGALEGSTLLAKLNAGDFKAAAREFERWIKGTVDGRKVTLPGLVRRRRAERSLFEDGVVDFGRGTMLVEAVEALETAGDDVPAAFTSLSTAPSGDDLETRFTAEFDRWGIRYFKAHELLYLGVRNADPNSPAYGKNHLPEEKLWRNIRPTVKVLDALRHRIGSPIQTLSIYRSPAYNAAIGGATASMHMEFNAIDFFVKDTTLGPAQWAEILRQMKAAGEFDGWIGVYPSFVHIDTRKDI